MHLKTWFILTAGHLFPVELSFWWISQQMDIHAAKSLEYINFAYFALVILHGGWFLYHKYGDKMERLLNFVDCIKQPAAPSNAQLPDWEIEANAEN